MLSKYYLSGGNIIDIRCAVISIIDPHFASVYDKLPIEAPSITQADDRRTTEQIGQITSKQPVFYIASVNARTAPSSCVACRFLFFHLTFELLIPFLKYTLMQNS